MDKVAQEVPHNVEAEQALLGAVFINNEAYYRVNDIIGHNDFYEPVHCDIFEIVEKLVGAGKTASPVNVKKFLPDSLTEDMTMMQYLAQLSAGATTIINARDFAHEIKESALRRELIMIAQQTEHDAFNPKIDTPAATILEQAEQALFALAETGTAKHTILTFSDASTRSLESAAAAYQRDGSLSGLPTGLHDLDRLMGGLQASDLIILAARPAMGKTSLATNVAFNLANAGTPVLFFSLEMSSEQLATRILAEQSEISSSDIRRGNIHESQFQHLADAQKRLREIPLLIDEQGGQSIGQIFAKARRLKRTKNIGCIVVDYIQLLSGDGRHGGNKANEIAEITTKLKVMAKELHVPVIALSQLSRNVESRENKKPHLSDLRDGGSIEQDADVVLFLYREEYYLKAKEPREGSPEHLVWQGDMEKVHGRADCIIGKQRHGATGTVQLAFEAKYTRFGNLAKQEYLPMRMA